MYIIITIIIVLLFAYIFSYFGKKLNIPSVVALIICGLVLNIPFIRNYFLEPNTGIISFIGDFALLFLMFIAGLESSWKIMYKEKKDSGTIAFFGTLIPFLIGFLTFYLFDFSLMVSLIVGICMSITAEAAKAKLLLDLNKLKTKVGSALMGAGIIDDLIGILMFMGVTYSLNNSFARENLSLIGAVIMFILGVIIQTKYGRDHKIINWLEKILFWVFIPFFFVSVGIHFQFSTLIFNPLFVLIVIIIAIIGKLLGSLMAKPFTSFSYKQIHLIGWAMNSRGAVEIALALIAFKNNLIPAEVYSTLVIMALVTTMIFPFVLIRDIKKYADIMD